MALRQEKEHRAYVCIEIKKMRYTFTPRNYILYTNQTTKQTKTEIPNKRKLHFITRLRFFFFILKLYTAAQFTTERDESHARLVLSCLNSFLLSPFQRVDLGQITPLNLLPLPLISDFIRRGMD